MRQRLAAGSVGVACFGLATLLAARGDAEPRVPVVPSVPFVPGDPTLLASSPGARGESLLRAGLYADYARAPLVLVSPNQNAHAVVEEQLWLRAAAAFSWRHRWLAALEVPVLLRQRGEAQPFAGVAPASESMALGDPQVLLRGRVLGPADGFALGVGLRGSLPLATEVYAGASGPTLGAFLSAGHQAKASYSAFSLGFGWQKAQTLPGVLPTRLGGAVQLGLGGGVALDGGATTRLGPELAVNLVVGNGASLLDPRSTVCQLLLHLQHRILGGPFEVGAAFGPALGRAPGAADYRAILSLAFAPEVPVPPPDADGDRVPDHSDMCPSLPGEQSEDPLMHGCPSVPSDADGDGIPDTLDACPRTPGEPSIQRRRHGCPPAPPEPPAPEPPPAPAPEPKVRVQTEQLTVIEQVRFETGTALLRPESLGLLQEVAELFRLRPDIELCEIAGHTDETGTPELNRRLSDARARSVRDWLVAHGVEAKRLTAVGYGDTRPKTDNTTEEGRAKNRRVEFLILRMAKPAREEP